MQISTRSRLIDVNLKLYNETSAQGIMKNIEKFKDFLFENFDVHIHDSSVIQGSFDEKFENMDDFCEKIVEKHFKVLGNCKINRKKISKLFFSVRTTYVCICLLKRKKNLRNSIFFKTF